jgi:hypothetical protein
MQPAVVLYDSQNKQRLIPNREMDFFYEMRIEYLKVIQMNFRFQRRCVATFTTQHTRILKNVQMNFPFKRRCVAMFTAQHTLILKAIHMIFPFQWLCVAMFTAEHTWILKVIHIISPFRGALVLSYLHSDPGTSGDEQWNRSIVAV